MFSTLMVTFREGVEAFLIISISLLFLRRTGRNAMIKPLYAGTTTAVLGSIVLGIVLARIGRMSPFMEGCLAAFAACLVIACTVHMMRMGKHMKGEIDTRLSAVSTQTGSAAAVGVFSFALLMVGREGIETATLLASLAQNDQTSHMLQGGLLGVLAAAALAWAWTKFGRRINLSQFFQFTAVFMALFAVQLVIYAFHEFTEAGAVPLLDNAYWHIATEPYGPEGEVGAWISYSLVIAPMVFLLFSWLRGRSSKPI